MQDTLKLTVHSSHGSVLPQTSQLGSVGNSINGTGINGTGTVTLFAP